MNTRTIMLGSCILAAIGLAAAILMQPGIPAPAAAPSPIQVLGMPTTIQVIPEAPVPEPVIEVLSPLPEIDPPLTEKPCVEKPPPASAPIPPKEAIQKSAEPTCQPCPVYYQPRCWSWRRYR